MGRELVLVDLRDVGIVEVRAPDGHLVNRTFEEPKLLPDVPMLNAYAELGLGVRIDELPGSKPPWTG